MMEDDGDIREGVVGEEEEESEEDYQDAGTSQAPATQPKSCKYPCLKCKTNVTKSGVRCNTCQLWVHVKCQQISKELYAILRNPGRFGGAVTWNCDSCVASALRLDKRMTALETRFQEVEDRVVRNEVAVLGVDKRMDGLEKRQDRVEEQMNNERERLRRERAEEMRERELRRKSVVLHRVEEAGDWARTAEERREWDVKSVEKIFRALKLELCRKAIKFCRRVGEKGDEPRPMVVGLNREYQKEDFLEAAKDLKNTDFENVAIAPDLTREQRKDEVEMGQEAERRNANLSEDDRAKNLVWMAVGRKGEKRLIKGTRREGEDQRGGGLLPSRGGAHQRGGWGPRQRGGGGPHQRGGATGRNPPLTAAASQSTAGRGGAGEREQLIELMTGGRNTRNNSKRNREENGSDEERVPPSQPQPSPAGM